MISAIEIAKWVVHFRADLGAPIDKVGLQKHLFYAQAFHLATHGEPLFLDDFQAWRLGPVVPHIWGRFGTSGAEKIHPDEGQEPPRFGAEAEGCLIDIVQFFGRMTPWQMSDASHCEDPWIKARGGLRWDERSSEIIPKQEIKKYYAELISDGEESLSRLEKLDLVPEPRIGYYYKCGISVRRLNRHPLYDMRLATELLAYRKTTIKLPAGFFAPAEQREFVSADEL